MSNVRELFGIRIRSLRQYRNMTQEQLAEAAELHATYLSEIERGEANPSLDVIDKLAIALRVYRYQLFEMVDLSDSERARVLSRIVTSLQDRNVADITKAERLLKVLFE